MNCQELKTVEIHNIIMSEGHPNLPLFITEYHGGWTTSWIG